MRLSMLLCSDPPREVYSAVWYCPESPKATVSVSHGLVVASRSQRLCWLRDSDNQIERSRPYNDSCLVIKRQRSEAYAQISGLV